MAHWAVYLTESIPDGVALATRHVAGSGQHSGLLCDLAGEPVTQAPTEFVTLPTHLLGLDPPMTFAGD
jgi:hypothetical protein